MIDGIVAGQSINKVAGPRGSNIFNVKTCNVLVTFYKTLY